MIRALVVLILLLIFWKWVLGGLVLSLVLWGILHWNYKSMVGHPATLPKDRWGLAKTDLRDHINDRWNKR